MTVRKLDIEAFELSHKVLLFFFEASGSFLDLPL